MLGRLQRDTIINAQGQALIDQPGGNLLYAAAAFRIWGGTPGLISRVGSDFPQEWFNGLILKGMDTRGIKRLDLPQDLRRFLAYDEVSSVHRENPVKYFAELGIPIPKNLLGYYAPSPKLDDKRKRGTLSLRPEDIPNVYLGAKAAHLCPLDYLSHKLMPAALRSAGTEIITLDAGRGYMHPQFWDEIPSLVDGLTVFLTKEERLNALFLGRQDIWSMVETIASFNCQAVVIHSVGRGQWLYEAATRKRFHVPPYPARLADLTSAGSSFCGGFAAGLLCTNDLLRAVLYGNAISSLAMEGSGAFYVSDSLPGLAESRLLSLEQAVQTF